MGFQTFFIGLIKILYKLHFPNTRHPPFPYNTIPEQSHSHDTGHQQRMEYTAFVKVKKKFILEQATKALRGCTGIALLLL